MNYNITLNLGVDKIYVINLKRHIERKLDIISLFREYNITNYEFIEAIDGEKLPSIPQLIKDGVLNEFFIDPVGIVTYNIIACAMSHRKAIDTFLQSPFDTCLILEDDIIFDDDFFKYSISGKFEIFKQQIKESKADIVLWGKQKTRGIKGENTQYSELISNAIENQFSAHAYQINRQSASKMFKNYYPLKYAADTYLDFGGFYTLCSRISLIQQSQGLYNQQVIDSICESVHKMNDKEGFDSATQPDRWNGAQYFYTNKNMPIDYVTRRNFKLPNGNVAKECSIVYFKTSDESHTRKLD